MAAAMHALVDGSFSGREHPGTLASGEIRLSPLRGFASRVSPELNAELASLAAAAAPICRPPQPVAAVATQPVSTPRPSPSPTEAPTATPTPIPTSGEMISIYECVISGSCRIEFPAGRPFYILAGFYFIDEDPPDAQLFFLEVDGVGIETDGLLAEPSDEGTFFRWLFNFPDGMTGTHTFTGHWVSPLDGDRFTSLIVDFIP